MIWIMITLVASGLVIKQHGSRESCEDQAHVGRGLGPAARSDSSNIPVVGVSRYNEGSDGCILAME